VNLTSGTLQRFGRKARIPASLGRSKTEEGGGGRLYVVLPVGENSARDRSGENPAFGKCRGALLRLDHVELRLLGPLQPSRTFDHPQVFGVRAPFRLGVDRQSVPHRLKYGVLQLQPAEVILRINDVAHLPPLFGDGNAVAHILLVCPGLIGVPADNPRACEEADCRHRATAPAVVAFQVFAFLRGGIIA